MNAVSFIFQLRVTFLERERETRQRISVRIRHPSFNWQEDDVRWCVSSHPLYPPPPASIAQILAAQVMNRRCQTSGYAHWWMCFIACSVAEEVFGFFTRFKIFWITLEKKKNKTTEDEDSNRANLRRFLSGRRWGSCCAVMKCVYIHCVFSVFLMYCLLLFIHVPFVLNHFYTSFLPVYRYSYGRLGAGGGWIQKTSSSF